MIKLFAPEKYAKDIINDFKKNNSFDPFAALMQQETKEQKMYCVCVNYLHELEKARDNITENFYKELSTAAGLSHNATPAGRGCSFSDLDILEGFCLGPSYD